jgi:EAL domain-containing protein (putative c-di-GMP-specific phosphodiesterase class I)/GGDEF domain-containing protein
MNDSTPTSDPRLAAVLSGDRLGVHFQPIVDLNDGLIIAYEALSRPDPGTGFAGPADMFEVANAAGKLWELEALTRAVAFEASRDWPRDVRLFLNCTPAVVADPRFADTVAAEIQRVPGLTPDRVVLEITELRDDSDINALNQQVLNLKSLGFHLALDDTGAGTSGLNRMMELRPQWIKLDREFVKGIHNDVFRQNLVRFFAHFARLSGVSVVAEGLETPEELAVVMGLGVRFAQGYYLGRPGTRNVVTDPGFVSDLRERWAVVESSVPQDFQDMPVARLCQPVATVSASATIAEVAEELSARTAIGVVVLEGRRLVGWCSRDAIAAEVAAGHGHLAVATRARRAVCALPPEASVHDGLRLVCLREDDALGDPIIVADGPTITGIVRVRELLRIATQERQGVSSARAPVTGLPARVRADRHIEEMIVRAGDPARRLARGTHADAAFIDIRRFADFNRLFGYVQGDRMIRDLSDTIGTLVIADVGDAFLAHLGDDRFLVTAPAGRLEAPLRKLMLAFDARYAANNPALGSAAHTPPPGEVPVPAPQMNLRVLLLPGAFSRVGTVRDVYRIEQQLRQRARTDEAQSPGRSVLVVDKRLDAVQQARLTA